MTDERFNEVLNGPLSHPLPMFTLTRLTLALRAVVDATGEAGEQALEAHCKAREQQDAGEDDERDEDRWDPADEGEREFPI